MNVRLVRGAALAGLVVAALVACRSRKIPQTPKAPRAVEELQLGGAPCLAPYLDAYPLGDRGSRTDLLAVTARHSMHLLQARRGIARYYRPNRTETVYILTGAGTCYIGDRSYPVAPGAAFKIGPGVVHSQTPEEGRTIVAIAYFEPPLPDGVDDRVTVP